MYILNDHVIEVLVLKQCNICARTASECKPGFMTLMILSKGVGGCELSKMFSKMIGHVFFENISRN